MAYKREKVAEVVKGKVINEETGERKPDYIKVYRDFSVSKGQYLNLESPSQQLENLENAVKAGKLGVELGEEIKERINKIPDFIRFEVIKVTKG